jgi:hypothetical protein
METTTHPIRLERVSRLTLKYPVRWSAGHREESMVKILLQIFGILVLLLAVTLVTLKLKNQNADGPSVLFPGGELVSGQLYQGPEPDWSFTDGQFTIELQTNDPVSSRRIFITLMACVTNAGSSERSTRRSSMAWRESSP